MIRQILTELSDEQFGKAAFIQARAKDTLEDIDSDLRVLEEHGYKYVFIDEVTLLEDFIEGAAMSTIPRSANRRLTQIAADIFFLKFSQIRISK